MGVAHLKWALDDVKGVTSSERLVLVALADRANQSNSMWLGYSDLMRRTELGRRTCIRLIARLIQKGFVRKRRRQYGKGAQRWAANAYQLQLGVTRPINASGGGVVSK